MDPQLAQTLKFDANGLIPAIVIGSLLASHTLLGLPVINRLGMHRLEPVTVTVGNPISSAGHAVRELMTLVREEITTVFENDKALDRNTHSISR